MNYSINNFFDREECKYILEHGDKIGVKFNYDPTEVWDCKRIADVDFHKLIIDKFTKSYKDGQFKLWFPLDDFEINDVNISITKYYDERWLDLHLDFTSQLTTVIVLTEDFTDGRFMLSETRKLHDAEKFDLKIGQAITFDGSKTFHGVMPVTKGIRCALNLWMTNTDFKYLKLHHVKHLL